MGAGGTRRRRRTAALAVLALLAGCTYADREPGLFGRTSDTEPRPSETAPPVAESVAAIPVLGEAIWTAADARGIALRIAVHGVRRVPGGTVLDWSITALSGPDRATGERIEPPLPLDLEERNDVLLVDVPDGKVYRPLVARKGGRCLCTPVELVQDDLAFNVPRLLQVAYPPLPASVRVVDVSVATAPVFSRVPVAAVGQLAVPIAESDLARPAEVTEPLGRTAELAGPRGQRFAIYANVVQGSGTLTSVGWTLQALTAGPGPEPGLRPQLTRNDSWRRTPLRTRVASGSPACLCSDPARWREHLQQPGARVTVVTNFGEVRRGTTTVDLLFPGVPPLAGVPLTPASDGAFRSAGTKPGPRGTWTFRPDRAQPGWRLSAWPTPVPEITKDDFVATVDPILD